MPPQVRQYRKLLLEKCLCALREPGGTGVPSEGMEALARILAELREGDLGSSFDAISEQCRAFFDNVSAEESLAGPSAGGPQMPAQRAVPASGPCGKAGLPSHRAPMAGHGTL